MKRCVALLLGIMMAVSMGLNSFAAGVNTVETSEITSIALQQMVDEQKQENGQMSTTEVPQMTEEPEATEEPVETETPVATEMPAATETPVATEAPVATKAPAATEIPAATEAPVETATPQPESSAVPAQPEEPQQGDQLPEEKTAEQLKQEIEEILEQSNSLTEMSEEELEDALEQIDALASTPAAMAENDQDDELQDLFEQLSNARAAMDDMRMAWQAKREGWLDQLPQTGKENSWRYQNGERIVEEEDELDLDLPDGVSTFSSGQYWGIDVSHHQGVINWDAVKAAGVDFAIIRCGFGMDLTEQDDKQWSRNVSECERLGIPYGVYFYSYAVTADMAVEEGTHAVRLLEGHNPDLPVFYDMEENRQLVVGNSGLAELARIFCDIVSSKGYEVGVYASLNWWNHYLTDSVFENWYRWVAEWRSSCSYNGRYEMWQYTSKGTVSGIQGDVDMNYWYKPILPKEQRASIPEGIYTIGSALDLDKVLDVDNASTENGANVQLFERNERSNQQFEIRSAGNGYYTIRNVNSGKYLDAANGGTEPCTNVLQWDMNGGDNQKWYFVDKGDGFYQIVSKNSGMRLDVDNGRSDDRTNVLLFPNNEGMNQKFRLDTVVQRVAVKEGVYTISTALAPDKVLDVAWASSDNGAAVQLFEYTGRANQQFEIKSTEDGYYTIRNMNSGKYLDAENNGVTNCTKVVQWQGNAADNQKWFFVDAGGYYQIVSKSSRLRLDVANGETANQTGILLFSATGRTNQLFRLDPVVEKAQVAEGLYTISTALDENKMLDVAWASTENGANVELYQSNNQLNQVFEVRSAGDGYYTIRNVNSGKYLDAEGGSVSLGTNVLQWQDNGGDNQKWYFVDLGNGLYNIVSKKSGLRLDVADGKSENGANILLFSWTGRQNQSFRLNRYQPLAEGVYTIASALQANKVLDVAWASTENGANVQLFEKNNQKNQQFELRQTAEGYYVIQNVHSQKNLDAENGGIEPGTNVLQWQENAGNNQQWILEPVGNGCFHIVSRHNGLLLDVDNGRTEDGTNVLLFTRNGGLNQTFQLTAVEK